MHNFITYLNELSVYNKSNYDIILSVLLGCMGCLVSYYLHATVLHWLHVPHPGNRLITG